MENNLDIFIFTHKTPNFLPFNKSYKLVAIEKDKDKIKSTLDTIICNKHNDNIFNLERSYSEGSRIYYIWKNIPLKKYIGTAHYRRYFEFIDDIPNLDDIFKTYDVILPKFNFWDTIKNQYQNSHNIKDLNKIVEIIEKYYPEYYETTIETINKKEFVPCNIFLMKREDFIEYCEFVFGVLDKYNEIMNFKNDLDVFNWVLSNTTEYCDNKTGMLNSIPYQSRIQAFLMERISNIFYNKKFKNPYMMDIVLTEVHFEEEKNIFNIYEK